ncbi:MAG: hypothetical protein K2H47_00340, partial [Muribaculaceae bacterium]|nr:hypothetical protein [Muribaculaceae bacterium]
RYQIYAVANVRGEENVAKLAADKVGTEAELKAVSFEWNEENIPENDQMFGFFTTSELGQSASSSFDAPIITVNNSNIKLNAWMRRLASKVTVAFDGSQLKENVRIYIQSVTLHDIPVSCTIGESNTPDAPEQIIKNGESYEYTDTERGETIKGLVIRKGTKAGSKHDHYDDNSLFFYENNQGDKSDDPHSDWYNKTQPADKVGTSINDPLPDPDHASGQNDYKDRVPYGTYIEVKAYYKSDNVEKLGEGDIIYRFMLGKDITYNYDAERNYHFKLTLKFNNWANDPDWHIVFDEPKPTIITPDTYYISYLYNQQMGFPVRIVTTDGTNPEDYILRADIIANNWAPTTDDPENGDTNYGDLPDQWVPNQASYSSLSGFAWNYPEFYGTLSDAVYKAEDVMITPDRPYLADGKQLKAGANYVGFLSLRKNTKTYIGAGRSYKAADTPDFLKDVYDGKTDEITTPRWWAMYDLSIVKDKESEVGGVAGNQNDGQYRVIRHADGSVTATVPMFTRAKELVPATDFSGNNFNDSYMRLALVKFTLYKTQDDAMQQKNPVPFKDINNPKGDDVEERIVPIYQVRRIVNPKAIWRKSDNPEDFHVQLLQRKSEDTQEFSTFKSRGPWRAYIIAATSEGVFSLESGSQKSSAVITEFDEFGNPIVTDGGGIITGDMDTEIDFWYKPTGKDGCGIIRVDYHDNTCSHLIFVRTGYDYGVQFKNSNTVWTCYNAYAVTANDSWLSNYGYFNPEQVNSDEGSPLRVELTKHPFSVGTFYKRNNYYCGILEKNNKEFGWLAAPGDLEYINLGPDINSPTHVTTNSHTGNRIQWDQAVGFAWSTAGANNANKWNRFDNTWASVWKPWQSNISDEQLLGIPSYDDFYELINNNGGVAANIEFGYGVAYTDGASKVAFK